MLLEKDQQFADMPAKTVRDLLRKVQGFSSWERPFELTDAVWEHLREEDLVEDGERGNYCLTVKGHAFSNARIGKPMTRAKAKTLLEGVVERAATINALKPGLVRSIDVFGSYTTEKELLGDIDLVVDLQVPWLGTLTRTIQERDRVLAQLRKKSVYISFCPEAGLPPNVKLVRVFGDAT